MTVSFAWAGVVRYNRDECRGPEIFAFCRNYLSAARKNIILDVPKRKWQIIRVGYAAFDFKLLKKNDIDRHFFRRVLARNDVRATTGTYRFKNVRAR